MEQNRVQKCTHINTVNWSLTREQRQYNGAKTVFSTNGAWSTGCAHASCFSHVWLFATLWTIARQAPLSTGFSRQECWSGLPCPPSGDLPDPGIKPMCLTSPALASGLFITSATWETLCRVEEFIFQYQKTWDGPWQHSTKWNTSDRERQILTVSFIYGIWKKNHINQKR